ncbi:hypothetical protein [Atlantibacter hermannii]|uniref:hypothetical protein n=1 Tax=Atlantibacter hermannii TaxID=565 RepID=UPI002899B955|nr:hypothetical protein [Atlantibacter hermannii]
MKQIEELVTMPKETFSEVYAECDRRAWSGCVFNGVSYGEWEIYYASLKRDEGYEVLL